MKNVTGRQGKGIYFYLEHTIPAPPDPLTGTG